MKNIAKLIFRAFMLFIMLFGLLGLYLAFGATVFGPKVAVDSLCVELVGMEVVEAKALYPTGSSINFIEQGTIEIFTEQRGEWLCVCQVAADEESVIESYEVRCLD